MDFATLNKQRKFTLIAAAVGVISIFLPWISVSEVGFSVNGFHSYGVMVFIGFIGAGILAIMGDQTKPLDKTMWFVALIAGAIALIFTLLFMTTLSGDTFGAAGLGIGIWISMLASVGVLASAWMFRSPEDSLQSGFDSLKNKVSDATNSNTAETSSTSGTSSTTGISKVAELERLLKLREEGKITEEEYQEMKAKL